MAKWILLHDYIKYSLVKSIRDFVNTSIITLVYPIGNSRKRYVRF